MLTYSPLTLSLTLTHWGQISYFSDRNSLPHLSFRLSEFSKADWCCRRDHGLEGKKGEGKKGSRKKGRREEGKKEGKKGTIEWVASEDKGDDTHRKGVHRLLRRSLSDSGSHVGNKNDLYLPKSAHSRFQLWEKWLLPYSQFFFNKNKKMKCVTNVTAYCRKRNLQGFFDRRTPNYIQLGAFIDFQLLILAAPFACRLVSCTAKFTVPLISWCTFTISGIVFWPLFGTDCSVNRSIFL